MGEGTGRLTLIFFVREHEGGVSGNREYSILRIPTCQHRFAPKPASGLESACLIIEERRTSVSEDRMAAAGAMLTAIFSHAADRSGLSQRQFEVKVLHHHRSQEANRISPKNCRPRADWEGKTRFR